MHCFSGGCPSKRSIIKLVSGAYVWDRLKFLKLKEAVKVVSIY